MEVLKRVSLSDPQQHKVYQAEYEHSAYDDTFRRLREARSWARKIGGSLWMATNFPHMATSNVEVTLSFRPGVCTSHVLINYIDLPRGWYSKLIICHELAHLCNIESEEFQKVRKEDGASWSCFSRQTFLSDLLEDCSVCDG